MANSFKGASKMLQFRKALVEQLLYSSWWKDISIDR